MLFAVVRNPWRRAVSCYEKKIRAAYVKPFYKGVALISGYEGLNSAMSFDEFVEWLCAQQGQDEVANRHWMSQHRFLSLPETGQQLQILKLESIERDLNRIIAERGVPYQTLKKTNSCATNGVGLLHSSIRKYYSARTMNAIGDRYAKDIELFGYDF